MTQRVKVVFFYCNYLIKEYPFKNFKVLLYQETKNST